MRADTDKPDVIKTRQDGDGEHKGGNACNAYQAANSSSTAANSSSSSNQQRR